MAGPSQYVRQKREEAARRRLEVAKLLRDDPKLTNLALADVLNVSRNTITEDRKAIMTEVQNNTLTEVERTRAKLLGELEELKFEVEQHRKQGKLSLQAIDRLLDISKTIIELTGARKPVVEKRQISNRSTFSFRCVDAPVPQWDKYPKPTIEAAQPLPLPEGKEISNTNSGDQEKGAL
jgi:hypothetical protein